MYELKIKKYSIVLLYNLGNEIENLGRKKSTWFENININLEEAKNILVFKLRYEE